MRLMLYVRGMDTDLDWSFGAVRWTRYWKLGPHMSEPKSPSFFPSSAGAPSKTTDILGPVLNANKPCVGLCIFILVRVELNIVPVAWSALSWLPEGASQQPSCVWCSLVTEQWDCFRPRPGCKLSHGPRKLLRKPELRYELKMQPDSFSVARNTWTIYTACICALEKEFVLGSLVRYRLFELGLKLGVFRCCLST